MHARSAILYLCTRALGCPYLGGKGQVDTPLPVLEVYLGSQGSIVGGALPSLPFAHQKYSSSDLPPLVTYVLDNAYSEAMQQLLLNPELAALQVDDGGYSPLQWAAMLGADSFVELYHNYQAPLNPASSKYPPLHVAVMQNHSHTVKLLLHLGAQVTLKSSKGLTPFLHALDEGHLDLAALLLTAGANVNDRVTDSSMQIPAIGFAAMRGEVSLVQLLVHAGADRGLSSALGHTPLMFAAAANHLTVVNMLLVEQSISAVVATAEKRCPASFATECAINNKENGKGRSALIWAVTGDPTGQRATVPRSAGRPKPIGYNAPVNLPLSAEQDKAYNAKQVELVELLLMHGADPNAVDKAGQSALYLAATEEYHSSQNARSHGVASDAPWPVGRPDLVESLLKGGAVPRTTKDDMGRSSSQTESEAAHMIQWAVEWNHHEILRLILFSPPHVPRTTGEQNISQPVLKLAQISSRNGANLLGQALAQKSWNLAEILVLGGCDRGGVDTTQLLDFYRKQAESGSELSAEQLSVYLSLHHISPFVCGQMRQQNLGTVEVRLLQTEFHLLNRLQVGNESANGTWSLLQRLVGTRSVLSRFWDLLV